MGKKLKYEIEITFKGGKKPCKRGHQPGDKWMMGETTPAGICTMAFNAIYPLASAMQFDADFPWQKEDKESTPVSCPDPEVQSIWELRRIPTKPKGEN